MSAFLTKIFQLIAGYFAKYIFDYIIFAIEFFVKKAKRSKEQSDSLKKYQEAVDNKLSPEEKAKRAEDLLNSGSH